MNPTPRRWPEDGPTWAPATTDAYQVDVVVALFAVLLILLLTAAVPLRTEPSQDSRQQYRPQDSPGAPMLLRALAPTYPYRSIWIVRNGQLTELDLVSVARVYLEGLPDLTPAVLTVTPDPGGTLDGFVLRLQLADTDLPAALTARRLRVDDPAAAGVLAGVGAGLLLYVWPGELARLQPLLAQLREREVCHQLALEVPDETVKLARIHQRFAGEQVLRCY